MTWTALPFPLYTAILLTSFVFFLLLRRMRCCCSCTVHRCTPYQASLLWATLAVLSVMFIALGVSSLLELANREWVRPVFLPLLGGVCLVVVFVCGKRSNSGIHRLACALVNDDGDDDDEEADEIAHGKARADGPVPTADSSSVAVTVAQPVTLRPSTAPSSISTAATPARSPTSPDF
jgi:hypothetical protein